MKKIIRSGHIGLLTSGGDTPGLNAAIRGIGKTAANDGSDPYSQIDTLAYNGLADSLKAFQAATTFKPNRSGLSSGGL